MYSPQSPTYTHKSPKYYPKSPTYTPNTSHSNNALTCTKEPYRPLPFNYSRNRNLFLWKQSLAFPSSLSSCVPGMSSGPGLCEIPVDTFQLAGSRKTKHVHIRKMCISFQCPKDVHIRNMCISETCAYPKDVHIRKMYTSFNFNLPAPERYAHLSGSCKSKLAKPKVEGTPTVGSILTPRGLYRWDSLVPIHHLPVPGGK